MSEEWSFENLDCYRLSLTLLKAAHRLAETLPDHERYNLAEQLRRASTSVCLNIAEGYGRFHYLDKLRFLYIARGSLNEVLSGFVIAKELGFCSEEQLVWARNLKRDAEKALNGYCRSLRKQEQGKNEFGPTIMQENSISYAAAESLIANDHSPPSSEP